MCGRAASPVRSIASACNKASAPSSLFRCSSQKLSAAELPFSPEILESWTTTCRKNSGLPRCFPLFFAVLDIHPTSPGILLTFARDNPALSPERRTWVRAGPPVFAENLQALTIPLRSPRCAFNIVVLLTVIPAKCRNDMSCYARESYYKNTQFVN
jgi:hypothetical protein